MHAITYQRRHRQQPEQSIEVKQTSLVPLAVGTIRQETSCIANVTSPRRSKGLF